MPDIKAANIAATLLGVTEIHKHISYFIGKGFTMGIARSCPLTIWIKYTPVNGQVREQEWTFLPHLASVFRLHKTKSR